MIRHKQLSDYEPQQPSTQTPRKENSTSSQSLLQTPTASLSNKTPSSQRKNNQPSLPVNAYQIRQELERFGMYCNDRDALIRCPQSMDRISEIITDAPRSVMAETSVKKVMAAVEANYTQNEKTLFRKVQPLVVKIARDIAGQHSDPSNGVETVKQTFEEDGLQIIEDCTFIRKLLPSADAVTNNKTIGLTDPKPDLTYGITTERTSEAEYRVPQHLFAYLSVAPGMRYPFYVEEHKSAEEGIIKAEHQAIRDGAVLVNARMKLNEVLKPEKDLTVGPDTDSFVFSCAWTPDIARIYVNWYERRGEGSRGLFHMHKIGGTYTMDRPDDIKKLRHDIHNILDWGLLDFRKRGQRVWEDIVGYYQESNAAGEAED